MNVQLPTPRRVLSVRRLGLLATTIAGLAGGLIYDQVKKSEQNSYNQGYAAGRHSASSSQ